jgi:predicted ATPase
VVVNQELNSHLIWTGECISAFIMAFIKEIGLVTSSREAVEIEGEYFLAAKSVQGSQLTFVTIKGYKSIHDLTKFELKNINVLIGPNGVGKSNFISFFKLLNALVEGNLGSYISKSGSPDALLYFGRKKTPLFQAELYFGNNGYKFSLEPTVDNRMMFSEEELWWNMRGFDPLGSGHFETKIDCGIQPVIASHVIDALKKWRVYHFHDTSENSRMKQVGKISDNEYLRPDASNLAAFLYLIKEENSDTYTKIIKTVRLAFPAFGDFILRQQPENKTSIQLGWKEKGSDELFLAHQLSDGTLRFICLATLLLQPDEYLPDTILIDEPELGLHPYAVKLLAGMLKSAADDRQVIVSTQSVELVDGFEADDIVVVNRRDEQSKLERLDLERLTPWLEDYSLGQLWKKNLLGGRP